MFRRGLVAMTSRLLLCVAFVANILVLVACTETTQVITKNVSSASETHALSSSTKTVKSKPKCRRVMKCPKNEEFSFSPESKQRAQYCLEKAEPSTYRSTSSKACEGRCICKENYLRAENGTCIPAAQCPVTCGANEILVNCPTDCQSDYCPTGPDTEAKPCLMPDVCPPPACKCAFNHRRASNGSCIPTKECPPYACGTNEEYNPCPPLCPTDDCSQASPSGECPPQIGRIGIILPCNPKCRCIKDYWRLDGICVPYGQCPGVCPDNERYSTCTQAECRALNCTQKGQSVPCIDIHPQYCKEGCVCKEGYLRNDDGFCVLEDKCEPGVCPDNERYSTCTQAECRALNCTQKGQSVPCIDIDPQYCKEGCVCKEGYLRNDDGICVLEDKCEPGVCPANERYSTCIQAECRALNCTQKGQSVPCIRLDPAFCKEGCVCKEGYLRNDDGICVLEDKCELGVCPANERYSTCTQAECRALNCTQKGQSVPCIRLDPAFCKEGCVCIEGYLRNDDGICVLEDKCEPGVCPANERYSTCTQAECRALNCTQKGQSVPCIRLDPAFCKEGCVCEEGYLRNDDGICVLEDKCEPAPSCTSAYEEFAPCMQGVCRAKDCSQKGEDVPCPDIPQEQCDSGCICKEHFLRAANGSCVPEDQCESGVCPANERYSTCTQAECRALNCTQKGQSVPCIRLDPAFCEEGCVCKEGYLRNDDGICVLEDKCEPAPFCTSAYEEFVPCMQGVCRPKDCSQKGEDVPCPDIPQEQCDSGCICKEHFLRAANGSCVPEDQCERNLCPINEEWSTCAQAICRAQNCSQKGEAIPCPMIAEGYCKEACVCKENYLRNENGDCVPEDKCPPKTCGDNEVLDSCSLSCNSDNCPQSADEEQVCTQSDPCIPACKCKFNYKRSENGTCIPTRDCPPFDCSAKPNEEFVACPPFCPTDECGKPKLEGRCPFKIGTFLQCNPKCQCKDGYGRVNGTCVPFDKCPGLCPTNEVYSSCVQQTCRQQNCSDRDVAMESCPSCDEASCQRGCVCQENYYRNDKGVCVSYDECEAPKICGENEVLDNCPRACTSDNCPESADEEQVCTEADPCVPACKCRFNYKRAVNGTCIPTTDCPPFDCSAKPNEEFIACPPLCPTDECGKPRLEGRCPYKIGILLQCNPKCQCKDGYGRVNGTCVPFEQCPGLCPTNEVYSSCVQQTCRQQNCSDRDVAMESCPSCDEASCQRGCVCQENYYRNDKGVCVSYDECEAPKICGENEVLDNCPRACTSDNCPESADEEQVCTEADPCVPACKCRFNYKRAENGTCIPTTDCPPFDCSAKPNEEFVACPPLCPTDECGKPRLEGRCPYKIGILLQCNPKCQCKDGYGRVNGTCVPFEQCPGLCPTNEVYSSCVQQTCRQQNCSDRDVAMESCPSCDEASCQRGCVCQENYYRNDKGVCVSYDECEAPKICGENEVLDNCPRACTSDNCPESADEEQVCTEADPCVPACKCRFNYKRAVNGTCIPTTDCPPFDCSAKPNEEFVACPPLCPTDECGKPRLEGRCPYKIGILLQCNPKCQCKDGYGRVNGTCVPFEQCPGLCPTNEVYSSCVQQTCRQQKCADRDLVMETCPSCDEASCQRGCVCQENYYRNDTGVCVSYEQCGGPMCPNAHEEYKPDFKECPPNTCKALVEKFPCDENQKEGPGCVCESGYLRINVTSPCIPICDCPEMKYSPDC